MGGRSPRVGVLLVNLGTPDSPRVSDVRRYLAEFLSDPRVIDMNPVGRWLLLHAVILRFRPRKSAEAYRSIWSPEGSPLLVHSRALVDAVQARLGDGFRVALGMRYGKPSIRQAVEQLTQEDLGHLVVFPLFPQYASAATGSALEEVYRVAGRLGAVPAIRAIGAFYAHDGFVDAFVEQARPQLADFRPDYVLMSYHGLPERQVQKGDPSGSYCLAREGCCETLGPQNRNCYRAQCFGTTRALQAGLGLTPQNSGLSFQSRLGRIPWIQPYTDEVLKTLAGQGVKRLAVLCPSFVADCLETLEEIGIRARDTWLALGGEALLLVPCPNAHPRWVDAVADLVQGTGP